MPDDRQGDHADSHGSERASGLGAKSPCTLQTARKADRPGRFYRSAQRWLGYPRLPGANGHEKGDVVDPMHIRKSNFLKEDLHAYDEDVHYEGD